MDDLEFFDQFDIWIVPSFLSQEKINELRGLLREARKVKSEIGIEGSKYEGLLDERIRMSRNLVPPPEAENYIQTRMLHLKSSFERKFSISLSRYEGPQFLIYGPGDFFKLHRDLPSANQNHADKRKISITLFLNNGAHNTEKDEFQGGQLVLNCPQENGFVQMPLRGVAGALVAFRSDLFHEVKPVITGERITLVGWFH